MKFALIFISCLITIATARPHDDDYHSGDDNNDDTDDGGSYSGISIIPYPVPVTKTVVVPKPVIIQTTKTVKKPVYIPIPVDFNGGYGGGGYGGYGGYGGSSLGGASSLYSTGGHLGYLGGGYLGGAPLLGGYGYYPGVFGQQRLFYPSAGLYPSFGKQQYQKGYFYG